MTSEARKIYFTDPQLEFRYTAAHTSVIVAGRRFGKTHGIAAPWLLRNLQYMPRSSGGIIGPAYQRLLTQTLPGTLQALEDMGFRRNVHYYVGMRPPAKAGFPKPIREPYKYDYVISWYNGSIWYLISQDIPGTSNSLTFQYIMGDEAKYIDFDKLKDETFPANGGFKGAWAGSPWLNSMLFMSDMPTSKKGSWFLNYREKMDSELINMIQFLVNEIYRFSQLPDSSFNRAKLSLFRRRLAQFRSVAVYYREWSSLENIELLGKKYISQMKRDLPPLVFQTSILCVRPGRLKDGFYPGLSESKHLYTAFNNSYLTSLGYDLERASKQDCRQDGDLDQEKPIHIAFDYNANINWLVAGQKDGLKMKVIKSFYVKYDRKLRELVDDFCEYYRYFPLREVVYYYDNTALGSNYAVSEEDFASVICDQFERNKWVVTRVHTGNPVKHHEKYLFMDQAFKGQKYLFPMLNQLNNEALILSLQHTGVKVGPNGFQKDKSGEKEDETEEDRLEHRTDGTDAFDNLFIGMNFFLQEYVSGGTGRGMGVLRK